jgi:hypothetical protein
MYLPMAVTMQPRINAAVADVVRELTPAVQRINYEIAQDWSASGRSSLRSCFQMKPPIGIIFERWRGGYERCPAHVR